ncbi:MAG: hypothetical protein ABI969_00655 [bacterium]
MNFSTISRTSFAAVASAVLFNAASVGAQDWTDRVSLHGSLNTSYGKSDGLGVFGVNKDGTSDYRAMTLLVGYKLDNNDRVVIQLLNRGLGDAPQKSIEPEIQPIWAFYEKKAAGYTVKLGRNPLPRGIFNEVRFVGTLLPFFRESFYGETLENIDGVVVSRSFDLGHDWGLDAHVMGGAFSVKYTLPSPTGTTVASLRAINSAASQLWLRTPIEGLRVGTFWNRFQMAGAIGDTSESTTKARMVSVDGDFSRFVARAEWQNFYAGKGHSETAFRSWYAQGGVKFTEKVAVFGEYNTARNLIHFPSSIPDLDLNLSNDFAGAVNYAPSANVKFKVELHQADGYSFDTSVPTIIPPSAPPFVMKAAPRSKANYGIASVAVSF